MNNLVPIPHSSALVKPADEIVPRFDLLPHNPGKNRAERIAFWHETFRTHLGISLAAGLQAGHELALVREAVGRSFLESFYATPEKTEAPQ